MSGGNQDSTHQVATGSYQQNRLSNRVQVVLSRFNYVVYERLGSNLGQGVLAFIARILGGSGGPFFYVENQDNLLALFHDDHVVDIPALFRPLTSEATGRWVYIYCQPRETLWEIEYRGITNWDSTEFTRNGDGDFEPVRSVGSDNSLFSLLRADLPDCYAIALPGQINAKTADMIFSGSYGALSDFLRFSRLRLLNRENDQGPGEGRLIVFDPGYVIEHTVDAAGVYSRLASIVDARVSMPRLSTAERRLRYKGILACLCKQLADQDSSVADDFEMGRLDSDFNRYADYATRKAFLIDNLYNMLTRPIMKDLQKQFMIYEEDGLRLDGKVWLQIMLPVTSIAGDHALLSDYLSELAEENTGENAWAAFYKASLGRGTNQDTALAAAWKTSFSQVDAAEMIASVFTVATYALLKYYVGRPSGFRDYLDELTEIRDTASRYIRAVGRTSDIEQKLVKVASIYRIASGLGELKGILDGDVNAGRITNVFDSLANLAMLRGATGLAMKAMVVKNIFDIYGSSSGAADRWRMDDYDAMVGNAIVVGAGIAELSLVLYCMAYGGSVGGPAGAVIGLISAAGAVIVMACSDSDLEIFAARCMWGKTPGEGSQAPWADGRYEAWRADDAGLKMQLNSLINCCHKYTVCHMFDTVTRVCEIKITTKFLPDAAKFVFRCEFGNANGATFRTKFTLQFPSRNTEHYRDFTVPSVSGRAVISANFCVRTSGDSYEIEINLRLEDGITTGQAWLNCQPFGHSEFTVPHDGLAFHLEQLVEHANIMINVDRDYDFESDEWADMPSWGVRG